MPVDQTITNHWKMLGHRDLGVTELRTFDPSPMVAYVDNADDLDDHVDGVMCFYVMMAMSP